MLMKRTLDVSELLSAVCIEILSSPTILAVRLSEFIVWFSKIRGVALRQLVVVNSIGEVLWCGFRLNFCLCLLRVIEVCLDFSALILDASEFFDAE